MEIQYKICSAPVTDREIYDCDPEDLLDATGHYFPYCPRAVRAMGILAATYENPILFQGWKFWTVRLTN